MNFLRWIHKTWIYLLRTLFALALLLSFVALAVFGIVQLPVSKNYIVNTIEKNFNDRFEGTLKIGRISGIIPLNIRIDEVDLYPGSSSLRKAISVERIDTQLDIFMFLQKKIHLNGLHISSPMVDMRLENDVSLLAAALKPKNADGQSTDSLSAGAQSGWRVFAPNVRLRDGIVFLEENSLKDSVIVLPKEPILTDINGDFFIEVNSESRFLDIEKISANIASLDFGFVSLSGQVYNEESLFEFNNFRFSLPESGIFFSGAISDLDAEKGSIPEQLRAASVDLEVNSLSVQPAELRSVFPSIEMPEFPLFASFSVIGNADSLDVRRIELQAGASIVTANGFIRNVFEPEGFSYRYTLEQSHFQGDELTWIFPKLTDIQQDIITSTSISGSFFGNSRHFNADAFLESPKGSVDLEGTFSLAEDRGFELDIRARNLNLGGITDEISAETNLNFDIYTKSTGIKPDSADGSMLLSIFNSRYDSVYVDSVAIRANWLQGSIQSELDIFVDGAEMTTLLNAELNARPVHFSLSGAAQNFNPARLFSIEGMNESQTEAIFEADIFGTDPDSLYGRMVVDIPRSIVGSDTLPMHQFYVDFTPPSSQSRTLRFTSNSLDMKLEGNLKPATFAKLLSHWTGYFKTRTKQEVLLRKNVAEMVADSTFSLPTLDVSLQFQLKNLEVLRAYFPATPTLDSNVFLTGTLAANHESLLFNTRLADRTFSIGEVKIDSLQLDITGNYRYDRKLKEFGTLNANLSARKIETAALDAEGISSRIRWEKDSINVFQNIKKIGKDSGLRMDVRMNLTPINIGVSVMSLEAGNQSYSWRNRGRGDLIFWGDQTWEFLNFRLENADEVLELDGVFSENPSDSMGVKIENVNLNRISDLIKGRLSFSGLLDGDFSTRSLNTAPSIAGNISIDKLALNDNTVGDIRLRSLFNPERNRFDTQISILTDSTKYPEYFVRNNRTGQNIIIDGYINAPAQSGQTPADTLYHFDLNFNDIDMWIIPFLAPKAFDEMEGRVTGKGSFWGNLETYDFKVDYQALESIYVKPRFLETNYYLNGNLTFTRERGLTFDTLSVLDPSGGRGRLYGYFDFKDFSPENEMDITLEMNQLQFLNNSFGVDKPFFGKMFGNGVVRMSGTNFKPFLRSEGPIFFTAGSDVSIPLLDETELDEDRKFIRRVTSFETDTKVDENGDAQQNLTFAGVEKIDPKNLTFIERFTIDLQFVASNPLTVRLIFDQVTGDIISAQGVGQVRVSLEDETVSMFGAYTITGGEYQFVSGDVFSRRFILQRDGTISWQGPPNDARLNVSAVFRARPDVNTLSCTERLNDSSLQSRRVPIDLVLTLGGTISNIENDFFFRLDNVINTQQDNTISTQLSALNRNNDEKLLQATSVLLTGNFVPVCGDDQQGNAALTQGLSGSSVVLNPLLSNQVISPLLSNQINSLLKSDVSSLDVDFNLNAYNQVDLGLALRLYNDRLIFRREGQITGEQSSIGDLGATYRINQTLSVTAFHRQDPTFRNIAGTGNTSTQQVPDINGVGLEAQVEFNSGKELSSKISRFFSRLFGKKPKEKNLTQNKENKSPQL